MKKISYYKVILMIFYTYNGVFSSYVQQPIENIAMNLTLI